MRRGQLMDIDKVRGLTDTELVAELSNARRQLHDLRFQLATRQLTDYAQIGRTRRTISKILTVQTERRAADAAEVAIPDAGESAATTASRGFRARLGRRPAAVAPAPSPVPDAAADAVPTPDAAALPAELDADAVAVPEVDEAPDEAAEGSVEEMDRKPVGTR